MAEGTGKKYFDGRMNPRKDWQVKAIRGHQEGRSDVEAIPAHRVNAVFREHASVQEREAALEHAAGNIKRTRSQAMRYAKDFGYFPSDYLPTDRDLILNTYQDQEFCKSVIDRILIDRISEALDRENGHTLAEVVEFYENQLSRGASPEEYLTAYKLAHDAEQKFDERYERLYNAAEISGDANPWEEYQRLLRSGRLNLREFGNNLIDEYRKHIPDLENRFQAQELVKDYVNSFADSRIKAMQEKIRSFDLLLQDKLIGAEAKGDMQSWKRATIQHAKAVAEVQERIEKAERWKKSLTLGSYGDPYKALITIQKHGNRFSKDFGNIEHTVVEMQKRLQRQRGLSAQTIHRRQTTLQALHVTAGKKIPPGLQEAIRRSKIAAGLEVGRNARKLEDRKAPPTIPTTKRVGRPASWSPGKENHERTPSRQAGKSLPTQPGAGSNAPKNPEKKSIFSRGVALVRGMRGMSID
ncbi:hypothetical protein [Roseibium aggregatum]|uniref:Uncharacterized protein n=1 Tax=Roseibium aggregatum TaxID=187304 RepID=A0A0M6YEJ7_9HYPH|nr:hypothetical protein [Roseibium aggregatum]CTQ47230.1 hypothetical protein LAL4801_05692 [Roseibium aggregatum]